MLSIATQSLIAIAILSTTVLAYDKEAGKKLHVNNCTSCHDQSVYKSSDRKIKNFQKLGSQVRNCQLSQKLTWFDEDVENTVEYLNADYYKFKK